MKKQFFSISQLTTLHVAVFQFREYVNQAAKATDEDMKIACQLAAAEAEFDIWAFFRSHLDRVEENDHLWEIFNALRGIFNDIDFSINPHKSLAEQKKSLADYLGRKHATASQMMHRLRKM